MFYKMWPYVERKKPSPYLLEYVYNLIGFALWLLGGSLVLTIAAFIFHFQFPFYYGPIVMLIATVVSVIWYFLADRAGWLYLIDKRKGLTKTVCGYIWEYHYEFVISVKQYGDYDIDPNKIYVFFDPDLDALRGLIYCRQEGENVRPYGRMGKVERELKTKDGKKLKFVRLVLSTPKLDVLKKLIDIAPTAKLEMLYWKRSKILIEFRPVEGVEYPPEALEYLAQINAMYP